MILLIYINYNSLNQHNCLLIERDISCARFTKPSGGEIQITCRELIRTWKFYWTYPGTQSVQTCPAYLCMHSILKPFDDNGQSRQVPVHLDSLPSNYCWFESTAIIGLQLIVSRFRCFVIMSIIVIIIIIIVRDSVRNAWLLSYYGLTGEFDQALMIFHMALFISNIGNLI